MTGVALSLGALLFVWWLIAVASGPDAYAQFSAVVGSIVGKLVVAGFVFAFFYHLCNGIRHLFWDAGKGFEMSEARASGWTVVAVSAAASALTVLLTLF